MKTPTRTLLVLDASLRTARSHSYDFLSPYLRAILGFIGITDVEFVYAHSLTDGNPEREPSIAEAQATARQLAAA